MDPRKKHRCNCNGKELRKTEEIVINITNNL